MERRLYRSETESMIAGVCGGLADYFRVDPVLIRLTFVVATLVTGPLAILAYLFLWLATPRRSRLGAASAQEVARESVAEMKAKAGELGQKVENLARGGAPSSPGQEEPPKPLTPKSSPSFWGGLLIVLGGFLVLANLGLLGWFSVWKLWPLFLILVGLLLIFRHRR